MLWVGRPQRFGLLHRATDFWLIPLALLLVLAELWIFPPRHISLSTVAPRHDYEIAVVALGTCRFLFDAWARSHLLYAVTNRRVLVLRTDRRPKVKSVEIGDLPLFEYEEHGAGLGTLRFDFERKLWIAWLGAWRPADLCFDRIERPREVYDLIQRETERWRQERFGDLSGPRSFVG